MHRLDNLTTNFLVAITHFVAGGIIGLTAITEFQPDVVTNLLRLALFVVLIGTGLLLLRKDAKDKNGK